MRDLVAHQKIQALEARLQDAIGALASFVSTLSGSDLVDVKQTMASAQAANLSKFTLVFVIADTGNGDAGLFQRVASTSQPLDGREAFQDAAGTIFERVRPV